MHPHPISLAIPWCTANHSASQARSADGGEGPPARPRPVTMGRCPRSPIIRMSTTKRQEIWIREGEALGWGEEDLRTVRTLIRVHHCHASTAVRSMALLEAIRSVPPQNGKEKLWTAVSEKLAR